MVNVASSSRDDNFVAAMLVEDDTLGGELKVKGISATGAVYVHIDSSDVTSLGGTQYAEDAVHASGDLGFQTLAVRKLTPANLSGADGDYEPLQVSAGRLWVDASGKTLTVDGSAVTQPVSIAASVAVTNAGTFVVQENGAALTALQLIDNAISGAGFNITQLGGAAVPIGAGVEATAVRVTLPTNGTGIVGLAAGNNNIGDVDIASGTVTTVTTLTGGGIAHDSVDSGNPHKIGFKAYSPDGTTPGTAVAELDRTDAKADLDGRQFINDEHPRWWSYHENSSNALTDTSVQAAPGAGFQIVITSIIVSTGAATALNFSLKEGATTVWGPDYLEAVAGRGFVSGPIKKHITADTAVTITTSAAIAHSIEIQGYIQAI